ncbi:hypothetical protein A6048_16880 [Dietzia psychralcaliphila]|uniref:Uncharacterized protein n=1 Tax=Dietzia psychralcaliphila TaxID=139021 RepID=A0AAD0JW87_9ACTN|nr:hypothetical protein A6048_16880 [Dietzia psychralcaliphila]PTM89551.1 hypothetical protein C8N39_102394 [Dietzia psychralcaliphila]
MHHVLRPGIYARAAVAVGVVAGRRVVLAVAHDPGQSLLVQTRPFDVVRPRALVHDAESPNNRTDDLPIGSTTTEPVAPFSSTLTFGGMLEHCLSHNFLSYTGPRVHFPVGGEYVVASPPGGPAGGHDCDHDWREH